MSILDIIIFTAGGLIVILYAFFSIRKTLKWKKAVRKYIAEGMTIEQAKIKANQDYKFKNKKSKNNKAKETENEEEIFTE